MNTTTPTTTPPVLALERASFAYDGTDVLHDLSVTVEAGEFLGIVGPNGAGKTTALRLLSGALAPRSGRALIGSDSIGEVEPLQLARQIAMVPQSEAVIFPWSVYSFVMLGRHPHSSGLGFESGTDAEAVRQAMDFVGITRLSTRSVTELSGGELHRCLIARALAQQTPVLMLDEPNAHLDMHHQVALFELLARLHADEGRSVVIITHDLNPASMYCDRLLLPDEGRTAGTPREVLSSETIERHFHVAVRVDDGDRPHLRLQRPSADVR